MKTIIPLMVLFIFISTANSQVLEDKKMPSIDSMLVNIDKASLKTPFLYERTTPLAGLTSFNLNDKNTANVTYFEQALQELFKASNEKKFTSYKTARKTYKSNLDLNKVNIGVINAQFNSLNYNEDESKSALKIKEENFSRINNKPLFLEHDVLVIAPLLKCAVGNIITYTFNSKLLFEDSNNTIQSIVADFGTGAKHTIYNNGVYQQKNLPISYYKSGYKTLTFIVTYIDGSTKKTYGKILIKLSENTQQRDENDPLIEDVVGFVSTIPFQGYNETAPIYGEIDYRIFYHNNNGNTQPTLLKPIVIIDGFDPGDKRKIQDCDPHSYANDSLHDSIEEMMMYNNRTDSIIPILRQRGYDVVIVNHPTYMRGSTVIDGGADYIERNAMNHVTLYNHLNATLQTNGSTEELVIAGPSMGGQISRYALAYMEKNSINHNTRLWVSIDSPHLGANISMGVQSLLNTLKDETDSVGAADFVNLSLGSPAAKQQLIEQYSGREQHPVYGFLTTQLKTDYLDAKTVSQGYSENRGHPFFIQFYDNMFTNGLPNSKGYPENLRKIAIVNGSLSATRKFQNPFSNLDVDLSGSTFTDSYASNNAKTLRINAFVNVIGNVSALETYSMPFYSYNHKISYFKTKTFLGWNYHHRYISNINLRGNLDNLSGGWFPTQNEVAKSIITTPSSMPVLGDITDWSVGVNDWDIQNLNHVSSFIPTVSALGFANPDFNWGMYIDTNLLCNNEIPFDTYYTPKENEQHTSFTEASVNWLLEELDGNAQLPNGSPSSSDDQISGASTSNECQTKQYIAPFVYGADSYVWTLGGDNTGYCNWEILSGQGSRILTIRVGKGFGVITCRPQNACGTGTMFYKNLHGNEVDEDDCGPQLRISPNPKKGNDLNISFKLPPNDPCNQIPDGNELDPLEFRQSSTNLWIYDFFGNIVYESIEKSDVTIISGLRLKSGLYLVKRMDNKGNIKTAKLIQK